MSYDSQPAGNIPLNCNRYQPSFPTLAMSLSIMHSAQTVECGSLLRPGSIPIAARFCCSDSHGRGCRFNPYIAHHFAGSSRQYPAVSCRTIRKRARSNGAKSVQSVHEAFFGLRKTAESRTERRNSSAQGQRELLSLILQCASGRGAPIIAKKKSPSGGWCDWLARGWRRLCDAPVIQRH